MAEYRWSREGTKALINLIEQHPNLYETAHTDYQKKNIKERTWEYIASELRSMGHVVTATLCAEKLRALKGQLKVQERKIDDSKRSGAQGDAVYYPNIYWFPLLKFLSKATVAKPSETNLEIEQVEYLENNSDDASDVENLDEITVNNRSTGTTSDEGPPNKKKKPVAPLLDDVIGGASKTLQMLNSKLDDKKEIDILDIFGQMVTAELKTFAKVDKRMAARAKVKIQKILTETEEDILGFNYEFLSP